MSSITSVTYIQKSEVRAWLRKRGKRRYIGFDDDDRNELRNYFSSLDEEGKGKHYLGSIGFKELEEPLIALGLAENRQQVEDMVKNVDSDRSGKIEFEEFLSILKGKNGNESMTNFFREIIEGHLIKDAKDIPFKLVVSAYRRRMIMDAIMSNDNSKKEKGEKVMKAFSRHMGNRKKTHDPAAEAINPDLRVGFPKLPRIIDETVSRDSKNKK